VLLGGGGARGTTANLLSSYPAVNAVTGANQGTTPTDGQIANGWSVTFQTANLNNAVFAVCAP
jgi:hypothetical protein